MDTGSRQAEDHDILGYETRPFASLGALRGIIQKSDTLNQLIQVYSTNIAGLGYGIRYKDDFDFNSASEGEKAKALDEWRVLEGLYKTCNYKESFSDLVSRAVYLRESYGYAFIEVIRDGFGDVVGFEICAPDNVFILRQRVVSDNVERFVYSRGKRFKKKVSVEFKVYVQETVPGHKIFFKEFGNKDRMSYKTGEFGDDIPDDELATELIQIGIDDGFSHYGSPRWAGVMSSVIGSIKGDEVNLNFFKNGRINPMMMTVIGGKLTDVAVENLKKPKGIDRAESITVVEVVPDVPDNMAANPNIDPRQPEVNVHQLIPDTHDYMFMDYQKNNSIKIKESFRLPPIYTGSNSDYNRATADTSRAITEEQVFAPDRTKIANMFNMIINAELDIEYVEVYFKSPVLSSPLERMQLLQIGVNSGAITMNEAREITGSVIGVDFEERRDGISDMNIQVLRILPTGEQDDKG